MDNGGIPDDWKPLPTPPIGCPRWKRDVIEKSIGRTHDRNKTFDCGDVGVFCCERTSGGWNYFWVSKENHAKLPDIDWEQLMKESIKNGYYPDEKAEVPRG